MDDSLSVRVKGSPNINRIQVVVTYHKLRGGIIVSAYPAIRKPSGFVSLIVTSGEYAKVQSLKRLSQIWIASWTGTARAQIANRHGVTWDLILKVCVQGGLEVVDGELADPAP